MIMSMKSNLGGSTASVTSSDLIDAKLEEHRKCGSKQCPGCGHKLEAKPVTNTESPALRYTILIFKFYFIIIVIMCIVGLVRSTSRSEI